MKIALPILAALSVIVGSTGLHAQAATDPNEGLRLEWDPANSIHRIKWWGRSNRTYFVQHSDDLRLWLYMPLIGASIGLRGERAVVRLASESLARGG